MTESKNEMEGGKTEEGLLTESSIQNAHHLSGNENEECDLLKEQMDCMPESSENDTGKSCGNTTTMSQTIVMAIYLNLFLCFDSTKIDFHFPYFEELKHL